jgi:hypothetical protein
LGFAESGQVLNQAIQLSTLQVFKPAQVSDNSLAGSTVYPVGFHQLEVFPGSTVFICKGLFSDEHGIPSCG